MLKILHLKQIPQTVSELNSHSEPLIEKEKNKFYHTNIFAKRKFNKIDKMIEAKCLLQLLIEDKDIIAYPEIFDIVLK